MEMTESDIPTTLSLSTKEVKTVTNIKTLRSICIGIIQSVSTILVTSNNDCLEYEQGRPVAPKQERSQDFG